MTGSNQHSIQQDFDTLRSHARAMKTGVWASYAEDVLDAVARIEEQLQAKTKEDADFWALQKQHEQLGSDYESLKEQLEDAQSSAREWWRTAERNGDNLHCVIEQLEALRETLEQIAGPTPTSHRKTVDQLTDAVKWRQGMARDALARLDSFPAISLPESESDGLRPGSSHLQAGIEGCTCLVWVDGLGNPDGRVTRDEKCPVHVPASSPGQAVAPGAGWPSPTDTRPGAAPNQESRGQ